MAELYVIGIIIFIFLLGFATGSLIEHDKSRGEINTLTHMIEEHCKEEVK